jgi:hypothetical protein
MARDIEINLRCGCKKMRSLHIYIQNNRTVAAYERRWQQALAPGVSDRLNTYAYSGATFVNRKKTNT